MDCVVDVEDQGARAGRHIGAVRVVQLSPAGAAAQVTRRGPAEHSSPKPPATPGTSDTKRRSKSRSRSR